MSSRFLINDILKILDVSLVLTGLHLKKPQVTKITEHQVDAIPFMKTEEVFCFLIYTPGFIFIAFHI